MNKHTWNLKPLFLKDTDPRIDKNLDVVKKAVDNFVEKWQERTDYLKHPSILLEALNEYSTLQEKFGTDGDSGYYFWLRLSQDQNNPLLKARFNKIQDLSSKLHNKIQFFQLNLSKVPPSQQQKFLKNTLLKEYHHFLEKLFNESKYLLSNEQEKILNLKNSPAHLFWTQMTSGFIAKQERNIQISGKKQTKNFSELLSLISSPNKKIRDNAAILINEILNAHKEVAEAEINAILMNKKIDDELRGFIRPDQSRHLSDDISSNTVDTLISAVSSRFDLSKRFYKLKASFLKQDKLLYHERNVEVGSSTKEYSFKDSCQIVLEVFKNLDSQFANIFEYFLINGQIDVYPKKGKRGGAFCSYNLLTQPTYIMLNHTNTLHDVLTLAHELGHGINNELIKLKQNALNFGTPTSTAEVASTFMEDFVLQHLLKSADNKTKLNILMTKLNDDVSSIFRQVACYQFEQELHQTFRDTGYLSYEKIGSIFQKHMKNYMGDAVEQSKGSENWWIYWSHIRSFFYVYSYASGLLISKSLQYEVKKDKNFINSVKIFLSTGLSKAPQEIFNDLNIDITSKQFWNKGLKETELLLQETEELVKRLGK